ncbi:MAG: ABC transporter ATP-binding protein [Oscillospiraceae bacterium]|jgi:iron complex transport system ATP-binding protein
MNKLEVNSLSFAYNKKRVIEDINLCVPSGSFVGIIGPNGSGKSTILKNIYGSLRSDSGTILLDGEDTKKLKSKYIARKMAVVGQENTVPFNFSVQEIVSMGRTPYKKLLDPYTSEDRAIVNDALKMVSAESLAERDFSQLSGGEKQRVLIARALAQQTDFIVLDEPTNHLDICFQLQIFEILKKPARQFWLPFMTSILH